METLSRFLDNFHSLEAAPIGYRFLARTGEESAEGSPGCWMPCAFLPCLLGWQNSHTDPGARTTRQRCFRCSHRGAGPADASPQRHASPEVKAANRLGRPDDVMNLTRSRSYSHESLPAVCNVDGAPADTREEAGLRGAASDLAPPPASCVSHPGS